MAFTPKLVQQGASGSLSDIYFNYVTMLLHGDGTNGAQNNTFLDSSTNNFTITRNGNATQGTFSPYGSNWSNYFSYNATAANYLTSNSLSLSGDFTIEGYVYWDGVGSLPNMFTLGDSFTSTGIEVYLGGGTNWVVYSNNATRITGAAGVKGQWTYIAVTRSGSTVTMYINGVSQGTWTSSATFSGTIRVGAEFYNGTYYSSMSGYISNFRVNNTTAINQVPTAPLTAVSGTIFLTCQSNRFIDNSSNGYTITVNGSPSVQRFSPFAPTAAYSAATIGGSGYFDGSGDYLTATASSLSGTFTVEGWVYRNTTSTTASVLEFFGIGDSNTTTGFQVYVGNAGASLYVLSNNAVQINGGDVVQKFGWTHVAVVRNSSNVVTLYANGTAVGSTWTTSATFSANRYVGAGYYGGGIDGVWTGYISGYRVTTTAVYTANFTPPTTPPTDITNTQLLLNFTNGGIIDNAMMNDLETVGNAQISTAQSKFGGSSLAFDGSGDYLYRPSSDLFTFGTGDFTVEFWMYTNSTADDKTLMGTASGFRTGGWQVGFNIDRAQSNGLEFLIEQNPHVYVISGALSTGVWYHVAATRSGTTLRLFIDGVQVSSTTASNNISDSAGNAFTVGRTVEGVAGRDFNGYIDDLRITKGYARYTSGFTVSNRPFLDK